MKTWLKKLARRLPASRPATIAQDGVDRDERILQVEREAEKLERRVSVLESQVPFRDVYTHSEEQD